MDQTLGEGPVGVPSVRKAVMVLNFVAAQNGPVGASEIGRELGLPKSSVHNLCATLTVMRLLTKDSDSQYRLGPQTLVLAQAYGRAVNPVRNFEVEASKVETLSSETLVLAVLDNTDVIYVATRRGRQTMAVSYDVGLRLPAYCTSTGKALLSLLPEQRVEELFEGEEFRQLTENSISDFRMLQSDLAATRSRGYSIDDEETAVGMYCLGAPIKDARGRPVAAVSVTVVKASLNAEKSRTYREAILQIAAALSEIPGT